MSDTQKALAEPIKITVGGTEKLLYPLTFADHSAFETWVQDELVARVNRVSPLTLMQKVDVAIKAASISYWHDECGDIMKTANGAKYLIYLGLHDKGMSFADFNSKLTEEELFVATRAFTSLNSTGGDSKKIK